MYRQTLNERVWYLRQIILIHSIIYYELNDNIISDDKFNDLSNELANFNIPNGYSDDLDYIYKSFDGSTGYHLFSGLSNEHQHKFFSKAQYLLKINKK